MTRVLIVKGHLLEGWIPKIEDKQVRGICRDCHHLPFQVLVDSIFWRLKPLWWDSWTKVLWRGFCPTFEGPVCPREKRSEIIGVLAYPLRRCGLFSRERSHIPPNGKRKIIFKMPFSGDMLVPLRVVKKAKQGISNLTQPTNRRSFYSKHGPTIFAAVFFKSWDNPNQVPFDSWDVVGCFDKCVGITWGYNSNNHHWSSPNISGT